MDRNEKIKITAGAGNGIAVFIRNVPATGVGTGPPSPRPTVAPTTNPTFGAGSAPAGVRIQQVVEFVGLDVQKSSWLKADARQAYEAGYMRGLGIWWNNASSSCSSLAVSCPDAQAPEWQQYNTGGSPRSSMGWVWPGRALPPVTSVAACLPAGCPAGNDRRGGFDGGSHGLAWRRGGEEGSGADTGNQVSFETELKPGEANLGEVQANAGQLATNPGPIAAGIAAACELMAMPHLAVPLASIFAGSPAFFPVVGPISDIIGGEATCIYYVFTMYLLCIYYVFTMYL